MKICSLSLQNIRQFRDLKLDFTYPIGHAKAGQPLEKVCFIGTNGTGKSTLLEIIRSVVSPYQVMQDNNKVAYVQYGNNFGGFTQNKADALITFTYKDKNEIKTSDSGNQGRFFRLEEDLELLINVPAESSHNHYKNGIPQVTLDQALSINNNLQVSHRVSTETISGFWVMLIYLIKKRENDYRNFESQLENQDKTVREVKAAFEEQSPQILYKLADLWNKILDKAGLEFDAAGAENPIQLTDNLNAYIRLKGTNETIPYTQLSTGIRNFIFRVGHIYSLYFGRAINNGFLLLDEPESSLHPDFLYDLIGIYEGIIQNTQLFVATHNPIIAAQFEPCERFILEFDDQGAVTARKGVMPQGDDPNDLLVYDFGVRNLLGEEGQKKWERFVELQQLIMQEQDREVKRGLLREWMKIGNAYKFDVNEIPQ